MTPGQPGHGRRRDHGCDRGNRDRQPEPDRRRVAGGDDGALRAAARRMERGGGLARGSLKTVNEGTANCFI